MTFRLLSSPPRKALQGVVAFRKDGTQIDWDEFAALAGAVCDALESLPEERWALDLDDAFEFAYALLGCWAAGKTAVVAPSHLVHSTNSEICIDGIVSGPRDVEGKGATVQLDALVRSERRVWTVAAESQVVLYTSGSTGRPKEVCRQLKNMEFELEVFNESWGDLIADSSVYATVSHRHVYGLLFRVLWPLVASRPFAAFDLQYPEQLLGETGVGNLLISSPALLKRIEHLPDRAGAWRGVFSSGGLLPGPASEHSQRVLGVRPIEVLGSTETSGVAWRQPSDQDTDTWHVLPRVKVRASADGFLEVESPFTGLDDWFQMGDLVRVLSTEHLELLGRGDNLAKIEDKRVSLSEIESLLREHSAVLDAAAIALDDNARQYVAVVVQLSPAGRDRLALDGRRGLLDNIKASLRFRIESVAVPKKFRLVEQIPVNRQGKRDRATLEKLFEQAVGPTQPIILERSSPAPQTFELVCTVPPELKYLVGHFPGTPVVPGVVQIKWAIEFGAECFGFETRVAALEVIKFRKVLLPEVNVILRLRFDAATRKLHFSYDSVHGAHSSGRIVMQRTA